MREEDNPADALAAALGLRPLAPSGVQLKISGLPADRSVTGSP